MRFAFLPFRHLPALLGLCALFALGNAAQAAAKLPGSNDPTPVYMEADKLGYDSKNALVIAKGNVEVTQGQYILLADQITYYQNLNTVDAKGNVTLLQPDGHVLFADKMSLKDDLKKGIVADFRTRLADNSLFAAREAERVNEHTLKLSKAVYSPCKACKNEDGTPKAPLWQLKASKVKIDDEAQQITYRDARMEVMGVPVAYAPYFSHPTPNADRKSGILTPAYGSSSQLGAMLEVPYYWNIAPDKDATLTTILTSKEGPILSAEYRQLTEAGAFEFQGSGTTPHRRNELGDRVDGREFRGHVFAKGQSVLSQHWNAGFNINRASDDTYLRRYGFGNQDLLTSRLYAERISGNNHVEVQGLSFQGLRIDDDPDTTPLVPMLDMHYETEPLLAGSRFRLDANTLFLTRTIGDETTRGSMIAGMNVPYATSSGHLLELDASVRGDIYRTRNRPLSGAATETSETRLVPQASLRWRYPLVKYLANSSITLEPNAQVIAATNGNNPADIVNEDSLAPEFSDSNLFLSNRYAGLDRMENGGRAIYGLRGQWLFNDGRSLHASLGQQFHLYGDPIYPIAKGTEDERSDIVGSLGIDYAPLELAYRFRLDENDLSARRNEVHAAFRYHPVSLWADYVSLEDDPVFSTRQDIFGGATLALNQNWSITADGRHNLQEDNTIYAGGSLLYTNECLTWQFGMKRDFIRDRDIKPDTKFTMQVFLKNLN